MTTRTLARAFRSSSRIVGLLAVVLTLVMLAGTAINLTAAIDGPLQYVTRLTDLTQEGTLGAWLSSLLLLLVSVAAFVAAMIEREDAGGKTWSTGCMGWLFISLMFLALSWDEHAAFHERIGTLDSLNVSGGRLTDWVGVFIFPLVLFLGFMLVFMWKRFGRDVAGILLIAGGAALFVSVPVQEEIETRMRWRGSESPEEYVRPAHLAVVEEGTELFASLLFFAAFTRFVARRRDEDDGDGGAAPWLSSPAPWGGLAAAWLVLVAWRAFAGANFEARESYLDPVYWIAGTAATVAAMLLAASWVTRRAEDRALSGPWTAALILAALLLGADYGAGLTIRSLAGHAAGTTAIAAGISVAALVLGARWFRAARCRGEQAHIALGVVGATLAAWLGGTGSAAACAVGFTAVANAVVLRGDVT